MMVKSMRRKTPTFSQLLAYFTETGRGEGTPVLHNLDVTDERDLGKLNRAFMGNARHCPSRKNGVVLYHEILSLSHKDKEHITPDILLDLARKYLSLRAPEAMAFGVIHTDTENHHVHLLISANLLNRPKKLRLSKKQFAAVKRELEAYEKEKYPELAHSPVLPDSKKPRKRTPKAEHQNPPIKVHQTRKETLRQHVLDSLTRSNSQKEFADLLRLQDVSLYERSGKQAGFLVDRKKYRFRTIGLEEAFQNAIVQWNQIPQRKRTIKDILAEKARHIFRSLGFPERIRDVLERGEGEMESERGGEFSRKNQIRQILKTKRQVRQRDGRDSMEL